MIRSEIHLACTIGARCVRHDALGHGAGPCGFLTGEDLDALSLNRALAPICAQLRETTFALGRERAHVLVLVQSNERQADALRAADLEIERLRSQVTFVGRSS